MANPSLDLSDYDISPTRGFLADPQLEKLHGKFEAWEEVLKNLPSHNQKGNLKEEVAKLPSLEISELRTEQEWKRAYLLLSFIGQSILPDLPENLETPWKAVSKHLGLKPFVSYATVVLYNFNYDSTKATEIERFSSCASFTGLPDESWFYVVHMATEVAAVRGLNAIARAYDYMEDKNYAGVLECLKDLAASLKDMIQETKQMLDKGSDKKLKCDRMIFYNELRPFFSNGGGVTYEDESGEVKKFRGASGAQTTSIYAFDKFLGLKYSDETIKEEIQDIQSYMPKCHQEFLDKLEALPSVREFCQNNHLIESYNDVVDDLLEFRHHHLKTLVEQYIFRPMCQPQHQQETELPSSDEVRGTGGTKLSHFLKAIIEDTKKLKLSQSTEI